MKRILILTFFTFFTLSSFAQQDKGERIETLKIAHISNQLNLDSKTAERFWPVYHQYEAELRQVVMEKRQLNQSDNRSAEDIIDQDQKALDIKRKYNAQFLKIIDNNQVNKLYDAEKDFRKMLLRRTQRMENNNDGNPRMKRNMPSPSNSTIESNPGRMQTAPPNHRSRMQTAPAQTPSQPSRQSAPTESRPTRDSRFSR